MNLWIFNHYAVSPDLPGGTRHFDFGKELVKQGYQVTIFASSFHHYRLREMKLASNESWKIEDIDGVKFVWLRTRPYRQNDWRRVANMISYMLRAWWLGRKLPKWSAQINQPDVVIGSSVHLLAVLAAYGVARRYKAKFIMEIRDLWPQTIIDMGELSERHLITTSLRVLERFLYRIADRIITLLPLAKEYLLARGVPAEKIVWIPNGVDLRRFDGPMLERSPHKGFIVMYLGAHGQANALDVLLEAAKIIQEQADQDIAFVFVGDGSEKPRLIELSQQLELKNVEFRDPVQKSEVPNLLREADATVFALNNLPLYRYGVSLNKTFDYLAAEKPMILAGNPMNNPVREAGCGLAVPPQDPKALAEAIVKLSQLPKGEREAMGRRGREYVEKYHAIPALAERLIRCIEDQSLP